MLTIHSCALMAALSVAALPSQTKEKQELGLLAAYRAAVAEDPSSRHTAAMANMLAVYYQDHGRNTEAESYYIRALRIEEKHQEPERELTVVNNLAALYLETGQYAKADKLNLKQRFQSATGLPALRAESNLASLASARGKFEEAESRFLHVISQYQKRGLKMDAAFDLSNLAVVSIRRGRMQEGIERLEQCAAALDAEPGVRPVMLVRTKTNLGVAYAIAGRRKEAFDILQRAATLSEAVLGPSSPETASVLRACSAGLKRAGYKAEAKQLQKKAGLIQRPDAPPMHSSWVVDVSDLLPQR